MIASFDVATDHALALLGAGQIGAYRQACGDLLREFSGGEVSWNHFEVAWLGMLAPAIGVTSEAVLEAGEARVAALQENRLKMEHPRVALYAGASLYRDGQYEKAIQILTDASARIQRSAASSGFCDLARTHYFLAMAHQQLGHDSQARSFLQDAANNATQALEQPPDFLRRVQWIYRIQLATLDCESRALIVD